MSSLKNWPVNGLCGNCLTELIYWKYSQSWWSFRPSLIVNCCPCCKTPPTLTLLGGFFLESMKKWFCSQGEPIPNGIFLPLSMIQWLCLQGEAVPNGFAYRWAWYNDYVCRVSLFQMGFLPVSMIKWFCLLGEPVPSGFACRWAWLNGSVCRVSLFQMVLLAGWAWSNRSVCRVCLSQMVIFGRRACCNNSAHAEPFPKGPVFLVSNVYLKRFCFSGWTVPNGFVLR